MCWFPLTTLLNSCRVGLPGNGLTFSYSKFRSQRVTSCLPANDVPLRAKRILGLYNRPALCSPLCAVFRDRLLTSGKDRSHFTPNAWRMSVSPMVKSLFRTARKAYWTETLWVLHHASCLVTPAQCEHAGSALCWSLSYGVNCVNIGVLPFVKVRWVHFLRSV